MVAKTASRHELSKDTQTDVADGRRWLGKRAADAVAHQLAVALVPVTTHDSGGGGGSGSSNRQQ